MRKIEYFKTKKKYVPNSFYLKYFLNSFWFIPSDVLQRSMEANIWNLCKFKAPVLDIGVGDGTLSNFLFRGHPQIEIGIDIEDQGFDSARAIEISKGVKRYKKVLKVNAEKMPFKNKSFNTVVSNSTFEHITNDLSAVSEVSRVLKKNGLFFITVPSEFLPKWVLEYEQVKDIKNAENNLNAFNERLNHLHYRSLKNWESVFKKNDMEIIFYRYYFPKQVALTWYRLFILMTRKFLKRERWSYTGHSKLTKILPKKIIINHLEKRLQKTYEKAFFTDDFEPGAQLFIVAKKMI